MINFLAICTIGILLVPAISFCVELFRNNGFWAGTFFVIGMGSGSVGIINLLKDGFLTINDMNGALTNGLPLESSAETPMVSWGVWVCLAVMVICILIAFFIKLKRAEDKEELCENDKDAVL